MGRSSMKSLYMYSGISVSRTNQRTQTPLPVRVCGFKSHLRHHSNRCQPPFSRAQIAVTAVRLAQVRCQSTLDNVDARGYIMTMTENEKAELIRRLTERAHEWATKPQTISFGKAPKDGWKESDRVAK